MAEAVRTRFYLWILPGYFVVGCLLSLMFPGDEYGFCFFGSLPGTWICRLLPNLDSLIAFVPFVLIAGMATTALIGRAMDYWRVPRWFWLTVVLLFVSVIGICFIFAFPSWERAIAKNGSVWAYVFFSLNAAVWLGSVAVLVLTAGWNLLLKNSTQRGSNRVF